MQIQQCVVLAHRLAISPCELRPQGTDALVQFLDLWLSQYRPWRLMLQAIHKCREEIDVLGFDLGELESVVLLVLTSGWRLIRGR